MVHAFLALLVCQLAGETLVRLMGVPVPGPVLGLVFLFMFLAIRGRVDESLEKTSLGLLSHLSLLFVPAGVGIIAHSDRIAGEWLPIGIALIASTVATIAVTALVFRMVSARMGNPPPETEGDA